MRYALGVLLLLLAQPARDAAAKEPAEVQKGIDFFESRIRPVLVKHCYDCHSVSSGTAEGGLRVDSRKAIRAGGKRGPALVPGKPQAGSLLKAVRHSDPKLKMPPDQKRLPDSVIADLTAWIKMGAPDPREEKTGSTITKADRSFWAYQPVKETAAPPVASTTWPKRSIDNFVLAKLEQEGLAPSADATPQILLRRLHFDLIGLPPSPVAARRFLRRQTAKGLDAALAAETDELLALQQFGEKWGRHWLDVARFGESSGGEANISFPYAWRFRDYVIDALNADVPYNRFLVEQIAGDLLPYENEAERARLLIATGFLAVGPKNLGQSDPRQFRADVIDEQINALSRGLMASSVACARCHNHKFDPFSMQDYYALAGIFGSTKTFFGTAISPANRVAGDPLPLPRLAEQKVFHRSISAERVANLKAELAAMQGPFSILNNPSIDPLTGENVGGPAAAGTFDPAVNPNTASVLGFDSFFPNTNFQDPDNAANQNGIVFFPGSLPLYKNGQLVGGLGVSGDGVDQDDVVTFLAAVGFEAPTNLQADRFFFRDVRLPGNKFLRNPFG